MEKKSQNKQQFFLKLNFIFPVLEKLKSNGMLYETLNGPGSTFLKEYKQRLQLAMPIQLKTK